jgi:hypothetical protein
MHTRILLLCLIFFSGIGCKIQKNSENDNSLLQDISGENIISLKRLAEICRGYTNDFRKTNASASQLISTVCEKIESLPNTPDLTILKQVYGYCEASSEKLGSDINAFNKLRGICLELDSWLSKNRWLDINQSTCLEIGGSWMSSTCRCGSKVIAGSGLFSAHVDICREALNQPNRMPCQCNGYPQKLCYLMGWDGRTYKALGRKQMDTCTKETCTESFGKIIQNECLQGKVGRVIPDEIPPRGLQCNCQHSAFDNYCWIMRSDAVVTPYRWRVSETQCDQSFCEKKAREWGIFDNYCGGRVVNQVQSATSPRQMNGNGANIAPNGSQSFYSCDKKGECSEFFNADKASKELQNANKSICATAEVSTNPCPTTNRIGGCKWRRAANGYYEIRWFYRGNSMVRTREEAMKYCSIGGATMFVE